MDYHLPRILIVDDERHNRQLLEIMLAPEGFELVSAASGVEALAVVAQQPPDVILLDVMMPGTDGYEVADQIKNNFATRNIPIIMITALNSRDARMQALTAGAEDFLSKPVDRAELCMRVRNLSRLKTYGDFYEKQAAILTEQAALLDLAQDAIVALDLQNRILFWSLGAEAMYGWSSEEVLGRNMVELLRAEFSEPIEHLSVALLRKGRWEGETVHYRRDGRQLAVASRWALHRGADGAPVRILTINSDVTERKRREEEIRTSEETFRVVMEHAPVGMALVDPAGRWLKVNSAVCKMLGFTESEFLATNFQNMTHAEDLDANVQLLQRTWVGALDTYQIEGRLRHKDGHFVWALVSVSLVRNADNTPRYFVAQIQDITARKEVDRIKSEFIATVSHELRTPLTSIRGSLGLVAGGAAGTLPDKAARLIKVAYDNTARLTLIVNDILDVEKIDCGKMSLQLASHSMAVLIERAIEENEGYAQSHQVRFMVPLALPQIMASVDPNRILQVLANLLSNAAKFSPAKAPIEIGMTVDGAILRVSVTDRGPGIPASFQHRLFERFSQADSSDTRQKGGAGLGLTISKALVEQMGGTMGYRSEPGVATTFFFELPVVMQQVEPLRNTAAPQAEEMLERIAVGQRPAPLEPVVVPPSGPVEFPWTTT
ncbi:MAG: PAS domain S-box protein [Pseudomonadota bacterium]|nr:PAS domain S-box protein [Pseudomonadota bacterium]